MNIKNLKCTSFRAALLLGAFSVLAVGGATAKAPEKAAAASAFLEITLDVDPANRPAAGAVYAKYKKPFLTRIKGARSKQLLIRSEDVQVLHGFDSVQNANAYLSSKLFNDDVVVELKPYLKDTPEIRIYKVN